MLNIDIKNENEIEISFDNIICGQHQGYCGIPNIILQIK